MFFIRWKVSQLLIIKFSSDYPEDDYEMESSPVMVKRSDILRMMKRKDFDFG
jgi:hypothetical protein